MFLTTVARVAGSSVRNLNIINPTRKVYTYIESINYLNSKKMFLMGADGFLDRLRSTD